jgi:hypothetical protein
VKVPVILAYDDLDRLEKDQRNEAHATRHISVDGTWYELDLTNEHAIEFDRAVSRYVNAGVRTDGPPRPPARNPTRAHGRRTDAYYADLVAYVDERKITKRDKTGRPAYAGAREGRNDYPDWLVREYDEYLAAKSSAGDRTDDELRR